jgi:hypothetical protein
VMTRVPVRREKIPLFPTFGLPIRTTVFMWPRPR